jgi:hypothetical protein
LFGPKHDVIKDLDLRRFRHRKPKLLCDNIHQTLLNLLVICSEDLVSFNWPSDICQVSFARIMQQTPKLVLGGAQL